MIISDIAIGDHVFDPVLELPGDIVGFTSEERPIVHWENGRETSRDPATFKRVNQELAS